MGPNTKLTGALLLVILTLTSLAIYVNATETSTFTVTISTRAFSHEKFLVSSAILSIPGARSKQPKIIEEKGKLTLKFQIPQNAWKLAGEARGNLITSPTITILLADYNHNKTINIILTSEYIIHHKKHINKPTEIIKILRKDPMAAMRLKEITLDSKTIKELETLGYIIEGHIIDDGIPPQPWEKPAPRTACSQWTLIDNRLGIYYEKNSNHPAASEQTPQWWKDHYQQVNWHTADDYWRQFRDRLVAAYYYVPSNVNLTDAIQSIASWAFSPNSPDSRSTNVSTVSTLPLEVFVGANHWQNTLPSIVYDGLIPVFYYRVDNQVDTQNSRESLLLSVNIFAAQLTGAISGLLAGGMYISTQSASHITLSKYSHNFYLYDQSKYFYLKGKIFSPGDYIVTEWKETGVTTCGGVSYKVVVPRTIVTPFYTVSLDYSKIYVYDHRIDNLGFLENPGISILLKDYKYSPSNYIGNLTSIFIFNINNTNASANMNYEAILGSPVFEFIANIFEGSSGGAFESLAMNIAGKLLDTGYINANFSGGGALITIDLEQCSKPNETYIITILNRVPTKLNNINGISTMTWGGLEITITTPSTPPPCTPTMCPTSQP